jgi:myosin-crossreactive antigen
MRAFSSNTVPAFAICLAGLLLGCSENGGGAATTTSTVAEMSAPAPAGGELPLVEQIDAAIAAIESELGGPQQYFEINATAKLVNLFVSLNNGAIAQPWVYVDGTLTSQEGKAASGGTFLAADVAFDPAMVLSKIRDQLAGSTIESFYINGDGQGNVQYGALVTSKQGGGLDVLVGSDGAIKSVDPIN